MSIGYAISEGSTSVSATVFVRSVEELNSIQNNSYFRPFVHGPKPGSDCERRKNVRAASAR